MSDFVDLSKYISSGYIHGPLWRRISWLLASRLFFETRFPYPSLFKCLVLRCFGARIGKGVVIKPEIKIKYPWYLSVGNYSWIGEQVWIDNLIGVDIADNCCVSQGALLLTGNHNYKRTGFDLVVGNIVIENGAWVGAKSVVCPGVTLAELSVLSVGSVLTENSRKKAIYQGNPATFKKIREILE